MTKVVYIYEECDNERNVKTAVGRSLLVVPGSSTRTRRTWSECRRRAGDSERARASFSEQILLTWS